MAERLVTLNVEGDRHWQDIFKVLKEIKPAIVCFQELFEVDLPEVAQELGLTNYQYIPTMRVTTKDNRVKFSPKGNWGIGILTNLEVKEWEEHYYSKSRELIEFVNPNDSVRALLVGTFTSGGTEYRVATTHFTWSPGGTTTQLQLEDFSRLKQILAKYPDLILCGDFNAPRGKEIFNELSQMYADNVPPETSTTIDNSRHYAKGDIQLVVDGMFTTECYQVSDVAVVDGVSDHMAISGTIKRLV